MSNQTVYSSQKQPYAQIRHIAFIMDGNGRWAKKRFLPREAGHRAGAEVFRKIMKHCCEKGIQATTFYVFSTENWKRPQKEVDAILKLLENYLDQCISEMEKYDIRFVFLGNQSVFSDKLQAKIRHIESASAHNHYIVNLALNYGARDELTYAFQKMIAEGKTQITEQDVTNALYTRESPELDLIVRTGGDLRLSNFLLWQAAYAEFCFTDTLWPDLRIEEVDRIIEDFYHRNRRFGGISETEESV